MLPALEQKVSLQGTPGVFSGMAGLNKFRNSNLLILSIFHRLTIGLPAEAQA
jgi:hypothetical protein